MKTAYQILWQRSNFYLQLKVGIHGPQDIANDF